MKRNFLLAVLLIAALPSCGKIMSDYVTAGSRTPDSGPPASALGDETRQVHVSPGAVWASGTHLTANLHTMPTGFSMQGAHVNATLSINANRLQ